MNHNLVAKYAESGLSFIFLGGETSHVTNMMFLQPENIIADACAEQSSHSILRIPDYKERKTMHDDRMHVSTYKSSSRGNPEPMNIDMFEDSDFFKDNLRLSLFAHAMMRNNTVDTLTNKQLLDSLRAASNSSPTKSRVCATMNESLYWPLFQIKGGGKSFVCLLFNKQST